MYNNDYQELVELVRVLQKNNLILQKECVELRGYVFSLALVMLVITLVIIVQSIYIIY